MTTSDYLTQLQQDKQDLVDNLTTKGISGLTGDETFTELVPEVLNIPSGGDTSEYFNETFINATTSTTYNGDWFKNIKKIPKFNYNSTSLNLYFYNFKGTEIDLSGLDGKRISNFVSAFPQCSNLINIDLSKIDTTNTGGNFFMRNAFGGCSSLETLNMGFDLSEFHGNNQDASFNDTFSSCSSLKNLTFGIDYGEGFTSYTNTIYVNIDLSQSPLLTYASAMDIINKLYDITSKGFSSRPYIKFNANTYNLLSADDIAIATDKGWNILSS